MNRRWKVFAAVSVLTMVADQITKYWARAVLPVDERGYGIAVPVIENFFDWRLSHNTGSAFGLFGGVTGARILLTLVGIVAVGAILWMVKKAEDNQRRLIWALGLVAGGAVGNIVDRVLFGKVTDFVVWKYYAKEWPTFNVADVALVVGVGLLFLDLGRDMTATAADCAVIDADDEPAATRAAKPKKGRKQKR
jgi:signal peptidase II